MADESYTKIPNDLLNALAIYKFNGRQRAIIDVICRYTFGFNRDYYKFPVALFETITGIKRHNISAELSKLVSSKVVEIIGSPSKTETRIYFINMNYQQWLIEKRESDTTIEIDTITIKNDTIENNTKLVSNSIVNYSQNQYQSSIENDTHIIKDINKNFNNKNLNKEIVDTADALPTEPKFLKDSFEFLVVEIIIRSCLEIYPNSKVPSTYKEKEKWAIEVNRMKRIDNRPEEEIKQALHRVFSPAPEIPWNAHARLPMSPLRTYIVEDNKVIYENLVSTLEELANVEVVGHASDEETAVHWLQQGDRFDLMIIDIFLVTGSGLGVLKAAQESNVPARRVVLTNYATPDIRKRCALLGADRVFDKSCELDDLIAYCERISDGSATAPGGLQ